MTAERRRRPPLSHDRRVLLLALLAGAPALIVAIVLLWTGDHSPKMRWTLALIIAGCWMGFAAAARERVVRSLQTLANMLAALREGDFSMRARVASREDPLGLAYSETNVLSETLRQQRLGALEATALLQRVMEEIDVAVFAFDADDKLKLVNRAGERLLGHAAEALIDRPAAELELATALEGDAPRVLSQSFAGAEGRWEIRRSEFRQHGRPHRLLVLADLSRTLREEERIAWQRLARVLSHEINNSLAPIKSIAESLQSQLARAPRPADLEQDLKSGLGVVGARAESLRRFMAAYARLARLPRPRLAPLDVDPWVRRVAALETRLPVVVVPGPAVRVPADEDQLEQLLINLVRNAADAALETGGGARVGWRTPNAHLEVWVEDDGPGLADTENLFVPFFTTKPHGSGVGLALSRQIAEAHGGTLTLENREGARGCVARLRLPLS
jgi:two-component system, NtrC family, nitrogen regulation sensor histidine kinase NtrY